MRSESRGQAAAERARGLLQARASEGPAPAPAPLSGPAAHGPGGRRRRPLPTIQLPRRSRGVPAGEGQFAIVLREFRVEPSPGISLRDVPARLPIAPRPRPATSTVAPTMLSAWCHGAEKGRRRVLATSVKGCVLDSEYDRKRAQCARDQFKEEASPRMLEPAAGRCAC